MIRTSLVAAIIISSLSTRDAGAVLIYDFASYPADQDGHSLAGTIVTTDSAPNDGFLMDAEILSWAFEVSGPRGFSSSSSDPSSDAQVFGNVAITTTEITMAYPQTLGDTNDLQFYGNNFGSRLAYFRVNDPFLVGVFSTYTANRNRLNANDAAWTVNNPLMNNSPQTSIDAPWVIATRVPEPTGFTLMCTLAGPALFVIARRRRRM